VRISARRGVLAPIAVAAALAAAGTPAAHAAKKPTIKVSGGVTQPVFSYQNAIREFVRVQSSVDADGDGKKDLIRVDIIRPKETDAGLKVPAIIDESPYYDNLGRGNESERKKYDANGNPIKFPLFYDNYFVPRGYAVILAQAIGTAFSTGCPLHGGPGDVAGFKAVIDWLMGRIPGYSTVNGTTPVVADWNNGKNAMIGKSYDGTFANGVAATGVDGLTTIVPISAISSWYDYSRMGGIRENTHYPHSLDNSITSLPSSNQTTNQTLLGVLPPEHNQHCASAPANVFSYLDSVDGDATGDMNQFWYDRDYVLDVHNVKASVLESHGINDDNVRPKQMYQWWTQLNVPKKLWLSQEGHVDPFDYRRDAWVDTLHRWFDYWLYGVQNGIMNQPQVDIERSPDVWETASSWPLPSTSTQDVYLEQASNTLNAGEMGLTPGGVKDTETFKDGFTSASSGPSETQQITNPTGSQANRLAFLSAPLEQDVHLSGTPSVDLWASIDKPQSNIGAILVDYSRTPFTKVNAASNEGVRTDTVDPKDCVGDSTATDSSCYYRVTKVLQSVTQFRISKGILDSSNRDSLDTGSDVTPGQEYEFKVELLPTDYVIPAGHQLGVILEGNYRSFGVANTLGATFTVDTDKTNLQLPVVGGAGSLAASAAFTPDTTAPVVTVPSNMTVNSSDPTGTNVTYAATAADTQDPNPTVACTPASGTKFVVGTTTVTCTATDANGNVSAPQSFAVTVQFATQGTDGVSGAVPPTLSLTLGPATAFGPLRPGLTQDYFADTTATVTSTAGSAVLSVTDPDAAHPGHLVNGSFFLPQALQAKATKSDTTGTAFNAIGGSPLNLLAWNAPVSNDAVGLHFDQPIASTDALRTGTYAKTLTFTLSTTAP
jgi:X-Pro dipeptidyl-peptidase